MTATDSLSPDGLGAHEYFAHYYADLQAKKQAARDDDNEAPFEVVTPAYKLESDAGLPQGLRTLKKRLTGLQWTFEAKRSVTHHRAVRFKTGEKVGQIKTEAHDCEHFGIRASRWIDGRAALQLVANYDRRDGKGATFMGAKTYTYKLGVDWYPTAGEMNGWLDVVAPKAKKPEPKARAAKEAA